MLFGSEEYLKFCCQVRMLYVQSSDTLSRLEHMLLEMEAEIERLSSTALEQQEASSQKDTELEVIIIY